MSTKPHATRLVRFFTHAASVIGALTTLIRRLLDLCRVVILLAEQFPS